MQFIIRLLSLLCFLRILFVPVPSDAAEPYKLLTVPPLGERWYSISMNGERVGFAHVTITSTENGYLITSESSAKLLVLGFSREASARESYQVNSDLSLRSFSVEQLIDKSPLNVSGMVNAKSIKTTVETKGGKKEKTLKIKGAVYPSALLNLYPFIKGGIKAGEKYKIQMMDTEAVKVKDVVITVVGVETLNGMETIRLRNDLYPVVDNDIWMDRQGNTIQESVRDGLILTRMEMADDARRFLLEDAVMKRDLILDFSLVRIDRDIAKPQELRRLVLELTGFPKGVALLEGPGQNASRISDDKVLFTLTSPLNRPPEIALSADERNKYLSSTPRINTDHPEITAILQEIIKGNPDDRQKSALLARWVGEYLKPSLLDSHSAVEALHTRTGNCQSHARLYTALARAAGIPSKMVFGLVYAPGKGFLYHSWAESYVNGWTAVDPTFGQIPADITHIKLAEGDEPDQLAPLAGIIGRVSARIIEIQ